MRPCDDPLSDVILEESVLSSMMDGLKVYSLQEHHFTSTLRQRMYAHLREGLTGPELERALREEGFGEDDLAYVTDVYVVPVLHGHNGRIEGIAELKRLHLMRRFCASVDEWRKAAPQMDWGAALKRLGEIIRQQGLAATRDEFSAPSRASSHR